MLYANSRNFVWSFLLSIIGTAGIGAVALGQPANPDPGGTRLLPILFPQEQDQAVPYVAVATFNTSDLEPYTLMVHMTFAVWQDGEGQVHIQIEDMFYTQRIREGMEPRVDFDPRGARGVTAVVASSENGVMEVKDLLGGDDEIHRTLVGDLLSTHPRLLEQLFPRIPGDLKLEEGHTMGELRPPGRGFTNKPSIQQWSVEQVVPVTDAWRVVTLQYRGRSVQNDPDPDVAGGYYHVSVSGDIEYDTASQRVRSASRVYRYRSIAPETGRMGAYRYEALELYELRGPPRDGPELPLPEFRWFVPGR